MHNYRHTHIVLGDLLMHNRTAKGYIATIQRLRSRDNQIAAAPPKEDIHSVLSHESGD